MAVRLGSAYGEIGIRTGDARQGVKGLQSDLRGLGGVGANVGKQMRAIGGVLTTAVKVGAVGAAAGMGALALATKSALAAGSDAQEMQSKFNVVFADTEGTAEAVTKAIDDYSKAAGRNKYELRGYAATIGDTLKPMGFAVDEAGALSSEIVKLGVDLASFNNMETSEALERLQGTLIGNHENALAFGVIINEMTLKEELARMGAENLTGAMLEQAKVQARINLLMAGTVDAQGDAIRTSDSWANQVRRLQSILQEVRTEIGLKLLPVFTPFIEMAGDLAETYLPKLTDQIAAWIDSIDVEAMQAKIDGFLSGLTTGNIDLGALELDVKPNVSTKLTMGDIVDVSWNFSKEDWVITKLTWGDVFEFEQDWNLQEKTLENTRVKWEDVFEFAYNQELGFTYVKIPWNDVFEFSQNPALDFSVTKLGWKDLFSADFKNTKGEWGAIENLKIGGFEIEGQLTWEDLVGESLGPLTFEGNTLMLNIGGVLVDRQMTWEDLVGDLGPFWFDGNRLMLKMGKAWEDEQTGRAAPSVATDADRAVAASGEMPDEVRQALGLPVITPSGGPGGSPYGNLSAAADRVFAASQAVDTAANSYSTALTELQAASLQATEDAKITATDYADTLSDLNAAAQEARRAQAQSSIYGPQMEQAGFGQVPANVGAGLNEAASKLVTVPTELQAAIEAGAVKLEGPVDRLELFEMPEPDSLYAWDYPYPSDLYNFRWPAIPTANVRVNVEIPPIQYAPPPPAGAGAGDGSVGASAMREPMAVTVNTGPVYGFDGLYELADALMNIIRQKQAAYG